jgi:hypothetical protein
MKRIVGFVAVATIVAALIAGPVAAQAEAEHIPFTYTIDGAGILNPCNGEDVRFNLQASGFTQEVQTPSGETITKFFLVEEGQGVGSEGNQYVYNQTVSGGIVGTLPLTVHNSVRLISQGSTAEDFFVDVVVHWNVDGQVEFIKFGDTQCRA